MNPSKRKMYAVLAGVGISLGAAGIASAASTPALNTAAVTTLATAATTVDTTVGSATAATADSTAADTGAGTESTDGPSYTSSVTIPAAADGSKPTDAQLQAVATVSSDEATAAALAGTPGTAGAAELKSVAGNVVWEVDVTATAGGDYDVIVDAGNSTVLDTHVEGEGHRGGGHGDAAPSYTSSVTIAAPADGSDPTDAQLQALATVTSDQAIAAALANTPGTAGTAELKSVAGNVVWEVDVTATAGGDYDVIVDAGNSTVLDTHLEGGHGGGHKGHHADDATAAAGTTDSTTTTG